MLFDNPKGKPLDPKRPMRLKVFSDPVDMKLEIQFNTWVAEQIELVPIGALHVDNGQACKILFFYL